MKRRLSGKSILIHKALDNKCHCLKSCNEVMPATIGVKILGAFWLAELFVYARAGILYFAK